MHEIFRHLGGMWGFTPPLSPQGKRLATYGDALLRAAVLRILLVEDVEDMSRGVSHILSRSSQAKFVTGSGLLDLVSLPVSYYAGGELEEHSLSTVLESVVADAHVAGYTNFVDEVARELVLASGGQNRKDVPVELGQHVDSIRGTEPAGSVKRDAISEVYVESRKRGYDEPIVTYGTDGESHTCHVTVGSMSELGRDRSKRKAKAQAFAAMQVTLLCGPRPQGEIADGDGGEPDAEGAVEVAESVKIAAFPLPEERDGAPGTDRDSNARVDDVSADWSFGLVDGDDDEPPFEDDSITTDSEDPRMQVRGTVKSPPHDHGTLDLYLV